MPEIPEGLAIEMVWAVEADYGPDARERRSAFREEHLRRIGQLRAAGTVIEAGGYGDWSAALLLVRAPDADAAIDVFRNDVYVDSGVWTGVFRVKPYGRVVRVEELPEPE